MPCREEAVHTKQIPWYSLCAGLAAAEHRETRVSARPTAKLSGKWPELIHF